MSMVLKVNIDEKRHYKYDLDEDLSIEEGRINEHLATQPSLFLKYARVHGMAKALRERIEAELSNFEHELDLSIREQASKDDKLTEARIKALVRTDPKRLELVNALNAAREQEEISNAAREAFAQRKDCLISLGANLRVEADTDLRIRKKRGDE